MQHHIPIDAFGAHGPAMGRAVDACVHCGFCLAACPTYRVLGEEMDSPRGRILLMKHALEGDLPASEAAPFVDRCLGCLACETACPSGVRYRDLLVPFRQHLEQTTRPWPSRMVRQALLATLQSATRFRLAAKAGRLAAPFAAWLPEALARPLRLLPATVPPTVTLPSFTPADGTRRARVALATGCVQHVLRPGISEAAIRVLARNGVEVVVPPDQGCCGALATHAGVASQQMGGPDRHAARFPADVDAIISTAAGCGSAMKEMPYPAPVRDISEFLDALGLSGAPAFAQPVAIAYQDACHLGHAQGVRAAPRRLLGSITRATVVDLRSDTCCGSAGIYSLEHPDIASTIGAQKAAQVRESGATLVATGNIGCLTQLQAHLGAAPAPAVLHTIEVLDRAYRGEMPPL